MLIGLNFYIYIGDGLYRIEEDEEYTLFYSDA